MDLIVEPMDIDIDSKHEERKGKRKRRIKIPSDTLDFSQNLVINFDSCLKKKESSDNIKNFIDLKESVDKKTIKLKTLSRSQRRTKYTAHSKIFSTCIILSFAAIISSFVYTDFKCFLELDLSLLELKLSQKVFGQDVAINQIRDNLRSKVDNNILIFYGSTGVGKTYTSSIILSMLNGHSNVFHFTYLDSDVITYVKSSFSFHYCNSSLIVIDDINLYEMEHASIILQLLDEGARLGKHLTLILISTCNKSSDLINMCETTLYNVNLINILNKKNLEVHVIMFEQLKKEHLIQCIDRKPVKRDLIDKLMKQFNITADGCKGVYKRIQTSWIDLEF